MFPCMSPSPLETATRDAIAVCSRLSETLPKVAATMDRARTAASTVAQTIDFEVATVRNRLAELTARLTAADRAFEQAVQASGAALDSIAPAAHSVADAFRTMSTAVIDSATRLGTECSAANQAIDLGRDRVNAGAEGVGQAFERLSDLLLKVQADVSEWHALATVADADDALEYGIEGWASAQDRLTEVITAQARALAAALAASADDHGRALLIVVNALIERCNAATWSVRGALLTAPPRLTADAQEALASFVSRLAVEIGGRTADLGELDRQAMDAQRGLEQCIAGIATTLRATGVLRA